MFLYIKASSKDQKILEKFVQFLSRLEASTFSLKSLPKQKTRKFVTVLKSPHVNKTAQEQFEFRFYNRQFLLTSFKPFMLLYFLKKVKNINFSGIRLEIKILFGNKNNTQFFLKSMNPDVAILNGRNGSQISKYDNLKNYVSFFDSYGEVSLKQFLLIKRRKLRDLK